MVTEDQKSALTVRPSWLASVLYTTMAKNGGRIVTSTCAEFLCQAGLELEVSPKLARSASEAAQLLLSNGVATGGANGCYMDLELLATPPRDDWELKEQYGLLPWEKYVAPKNIVEQINAIDAIDELPEPITPVRRTPTHESEDLTGEDFGG